MEIEAIYPIWDMSLTDYPPSVGRAYRGIHIKLLVWLIPVCRVAATKAFANTLEYRALLELHGLAHCTGTPNF